ncbi:hypothetical protein GCM10027048_20520 [Hymenobacter coalescens]
MASVRTDNVQIKLDIDGSQSKTELDNLTRKAQLLKEDMKGLKKSSQEYIDANKQLADVNGRIEELRQELGLSALSYNQLNTLTRQLNRELRDLTPGTEAFINKSKELQEVDAQLTKVRNDIKGVGAELELSTEDFDDFVKKRDEVGLVGLTLTQLKGLASQLKEELGDLAPGTEAFVNKSKELGLAEKRLEDVTEEARKAGRQLDESGNGFGDFAKKSAALVGIHIGIEAAVEGLKELGRESVNAAKEGADSLSDMEKSLGVTTAEARALREQLEGIDTRTSGENLEGIAVAAGQLGIAKDQAVAFTQSVDQAVVALGDEFTGGVEDVTKSLGGLQKLYKQTADLSPAESITKIGSAVNALGAEGAASGPVIAEFTSRIGQLGDLAPQITQTLGLGAAFQELGLSAEISSGGVTNVLLTASKDTAKFAAQIGVTNDEFREMLNTDPNEVLLRLADSLQGASNTEIVSTLDRLGIKSQEATKVMSLLATQTDFVREKQALAAKEFQKGSSLTDEFAKKNNNAAGELEKAEKKLVQYRRELGEQLLPVYIRGTQLFGLFLEGLRAAPQFISENRGLLMGLAVALVTLNAANIRATASTLAQLAVEKGRAVATRASAAAQWLLNAAMTANPIGLVIAAVALLVGGLVTLYDRSERVRMVLAGLSNVAREVFGNIKNVALESLGGLANLLLGIFTLDKARLAAGLAQLQRAGGQMSEAYHKGYQDQQAKEEAKQVQREEAVHQEKKKRQQKRQQEEAQQEQQSYVERLKLRQADLERQLAQAEEGSRRELELKKQLVLVARDIDLAGEKKSAADKAIIQSKALVEISKLNRDFEQQEAQERLAAQEQIAARRAALLQDETARRIQQLTAAAEKEQAQVKGSATQQAEQRRLIEQQLQVDIAEVRRAAQQKEAEESLALEQKRNDLIVDAWQRREAQLRTAAKLEEVKILDSDKNAAEKRRLVAEKLELDLAALMLERADQEAEVARRIEEIDADLNLRRLARARDREDRRNFMSNEAIAAAQAEKNARVGILQQQLEDELANERLTINERLALIRQFNADKAAIEQEYSQAEQDRERGRAEFTVQSFGQAAQLLADFSKMSSDKELAKLDRDKQARLKKLDEEYKAGKLSKEGYENSKHAIETNYDEKARKLKRRAAEVEKANNVAQSIIAGILGVIKAAPNIPLQIATGILAAAGTAKIIATPIPEFAQGGVLRQLGGTWRGVARSAGDAWRSARKYASGGRVAYGGGVPDGPRHGSGGIQLFDGASGQHIGEMEGGEPIMILSRATYANNRELVDELLDTSLYRGGAPIRSRGAGFYEDGGLAGAAPGTPSRSTDNYGPQLVEAINRTTTAVQNIPSRLYAVVGDDQIPVLEDKLQERADIREEAAVR